MASVPLPLPARRVRGGGLPGTLLLRGSVLTWVSLLVLLPIAALAATSVEEGLGAFRDNVTEPQTVAALRLTIGLAVLVTLVNAVVGTLIAWTLVRDDLPGRRIADAIIDLPFALPTIVSSLVLLNLYGAEGPLGVDIAYSRVAIAVALLFVTLPFVVRAVQPVLAELDREMEDAARSLGASGTTLTRRIVLPQLVPAVLTGSGLGFARALGEFGALVLLAGNVPFRTEVASVHVFGQIESDDPVAAAAVSVVLLVTALVAQAGFTLLRRRALRHAR